MARAITQSTGGTLTTAMGTTTTITPHCDQAAGRCSQATPCTALPTVC